MEDIAPFQPIQTQPDTTSTVATIYRHGDPFHKPKRALYIVGFVLLVGGLFGSLMLLSTSSDIRSRASNTGPVLSLNPSEKSLSTGETATLAVLLNTNTETVSVVKLKLSYDPAAVQIMGFTNGTILPVVLSPATFSNGALDVTLAVQPATPFKGAGTVGTISIKLLSEKNSEIQFTAQTEVAVLSKTINALASSSGSSIRGSVTPPPTNTLAALEVRPSHIQYGLPGDIPIVGNWSGGAVDFPAIIRGSDWHIKKSFTGGGADLTVTILDVPMGNPQHYLSCDWTGSGIKTPAIVTNGTWYIRTSNTTGKPDLTFSYGLPTDIPVCGNWTGKQNGIQTAGLFRKGLWYLRNSNSTGEADIHYAFGNPGDIPIVGRWTGTNVDFPGVYRNAIFYERYSHSAGVADTTIPFGNPGDTPIIGDWDGKGRSMTGVVRGNNWYFNDH